MFTLDQVLKTARYLIDEYLRRGMFNLTMQPSERVDQLFIAIREDATASTMFEEHQVLLGLALTDEMQSAMVVFQPKDLMIYTDIVVPVSALDELVRSMTDVTSAVEAETNLQMLILKHKTKSGI